MGTEISLKVSGSTLVWSKNSLGIDHGSLFQSTDHIMIPQYDRYGMEETDEIDDERRLQWTVLRKPLSEVAKRAELLGFTLDAIRAEYQNIVNNEAQERKGMMESFPDEYEPIENLFSFDDFLIFIKQYSLKDLKDNHIEYDYSNRSQTQDFIKRKFTETTLKRIPCYDPNENFFWSEKSAFISIVNFMNPYSVIRILSENENNNTEYVEWDYGEIVANGWVNINEIKTEIRREDSFLIATEGSSDSHILQKAFRLLKPCVADFFRFIDVTSGHPFPGTGGLSKFAEGLVKIDIQNQIVFLLDNDCEGVEGFNKIMKMRLPHNMSCMCLPDLQDFESFPSRGPDGLTLANINKTAAAIECYLDLSYSEYDNHSIRWTNYKKETGLYHGALEFKEYYANRFLAMSDSNLLESGYDISKLEVLLEAIIETCSKVAGEIRISEINNHYPNLWTEEKI